MRNTALTVAALVAASALLLTGCAAAGDATAAPGLLPTKTAKPLPVATTAPVVDRSFLGSIDHDSFVGFAAKDDAARDIACAGFFNANLPGSATVTAASTGPEIAQWFAERADLLLKLNGDQRDPRNQESALAIAECLTAVTSENAVARNAILSSLKSQLTPGFEDMKITYLLPDGVTRYGDGLFNAYNDNGGVWNAIAVEGHSNAISGPVEQFPYKRHASPTFPAFQQVVNAPAEDLLTNGTPPIVLDPLYADAPWHLN